MLLKRTLAGGALALLASPAMSADQQPRDTVSAEVFLQLHSIQQLAGDIRPLASAPAEAFRVIDGGTLALGKLKIRLTGIDAPDVSQRCSAPDGSQWDCAAEAADRIRSLMRGAERVECFSNDHDPYRGYLAACDADGTDIGALLVEEGLAWPRNGEGQYLTEASLAQAAGLGIWQAQRPSAAD